MMKGKFVESDIENFWTREPLTVPVTSLVEARKPVELKTSDSALAKKIGKEMGGLPPGHVVAIADYRLISKLQRKDSKVASPMEKKLRETFEDMVDEESSEVITVKLFVVVFDQIEEYCKRFKVTMKAFHRLALHEYRDYRKSQAKKSDFNKDL